MGTTFYESYSPVSRHHQLYSSQLSLLRWAWLLSHTANLCSSAMYQKSHENMLLQQVLHSAHGFREAFNFAGRDMAHWFPGHMSRGFDKMKANLKDVDCIIEVHDARIPLSGRNPLFRESLGIKPHMLLLNKMDLAVLTEKQRICNHLKHQGINKVIFTDCVKDENIDQVVPIITEAIHSSDRFQRNETLGYCVMVIGVPNVGKSSLINAIRRQHLKKGKASKVGAMPGITRAVLSKIQVCDKPPIFLLDTPGILTPQVETIENGMKLALCGTILDHLVGEEILADYLLFTLNKYQQFSYVERYGLKAPSDDVESVLKRIALKLGKTQKVKAITGVGNVNITVPNYHAAAFDFIRTFRKGLLGKVMLD
ncbi:mitochondrial ribosome-associated GTPase 1 isoform X2 [Ambystoma mexicanum]|uniref:mitochondrial ribosome-associated GTPase 1 isoform X2 n=1 Tax=Ambystoma mexicanum TaxID=8296 RepID=UPI0037E79763